MYRVRFATEGDSAEVSDLVLACVRERNYSGSNGFTPRVARETLFGENRFLLAIVAELERGGLIGAVLWQWTFDVEIATRCANITDVYVANEFRRAGVGSALCAAVARQTLLNGGAHLMMTRIAPNRTMHSFATRLGANSDPAKSFVVFGPALEALAKRPTEGDD